MASKPKTESRLTRELLSMAKDMHTSGVMDDAAHEKITMRHINGAEAATLAPLTGDEIRALREQAHMVSRLRALPQFDGRLRSQLERGAKRPTGPALALLDVIRRKGIEAII